MAVATSSSIVAVSSAATGAALISTKSVSDVVTVSPPTPSVAVALAVKVKSLTGPATALP